MKKPTKEEMREKVLTTPYWQPVYKPDNFWHHKHGHKPIRRHIKLLKN